MSTGPLLALTLDRDAPLGLQVERQLRALIAASDLPVGSELPSTRALAADIGVSRGVVVGAYAQLAAEGYIGLRRGATPTVAFSPSRPEECQNTIDAPIALARINLRPDLPDLGLFPRSHWTAAGRVSLQRAKNADLAYGHPLGAVELRRRLAPFLARTRGVAADANRTAVYGGSSQALFALARTLHAEGATRIAIEDPGHRWRTRAIAAAGVEVVPVPVDSDGLRVDLLGDEDAVVLSPDHHFPSGAQLTPERRRALVDWATRGNRLVIEHDYDAHFRYDRPPAGTLQALAPEHVAYVGSASALLAPALRIGWAVVPARLVDPLLLDTFFTVVAPARLAQLTLAELIANGQLDRHLRRMRLAYKRRRDALLAALARHAPELPVHAAPVGLYLAVDLPDGYDEPGLLERARARRIALDGVGEHALTPQPPGLALGFAASSESTLRRAAAELAALL